MLRSFWRALKPENLVTEDIHDRTILVRLIKPSPELGNYTPRLTRVHFLPAENYSRWSWFAPLGTPPTSRYGEWEATSTTPSTDHSHPGSRCSRGEKNPCSPLDLGERSEQIKPCSLSLSGVEKCRETQSKK